MRNHRKQISRGRHSWGTDLCVGGTVHVDIVCDMDVWNPMTLFKYHESILLLKMRFFFHYWRLNNRSVTFYTHEQFSVSGLSHFPSLSTNFAKGTQLAVDQLNVLVRSSCPLVDGACETHAITLLLPQTLSPLPHAVHKELHHQCFLMLMPCIHLFHIANRCRSRGLHTGRYEKWEGGKNKMPGLNIYRLLFSLHQFDLYSVCFRLI